MFISGNPQIPSFATNSVVNVYWKKGERAEGLHYFSHGNGGLKLPLTASQIYTRPELPFRGVNLLLCFLVLYSANFESSLRTAEKSFLWGNYAWGPGWPCPLLLHRADPGPMPGLARCLKSLDFHLSSWPCNHSGKGQCLTELCIPLVHGKV